MTVRSWKLDAQTGDLVVTGGRTLELVSDAEAVAQHVRFRLQMQRGEWFLDEDSGTDWLGVILRKGAPLAEVEAELRKTLVQTPGVAEVVSLTVDRDLSQRTARIRAALTTDLGELVQLDLQKEG